MSSCWDIPFWAGNIARAACGSMLVTELKSTALRDLRLILSAIQCSTNAWCVQIFTTVSKMLLRDLAKELQTVKKSEHSLLLSGAQNILLPRWASRRPSSCSASLLLHCNRISVTEAKPNRRRFMKEDHQEQSCRIAFQDVYEDVLGALKWNHSPSA